MSRPLNADLRTDYQKNYIINGSFDFWQRGTSGTSTGFQTDRFNVTLGGNAGIAVTQELDTDVPTNSTNQFSWAYTITAPGTITTSSFNTVLHPIEGYEFATLRNKTFTLSFWVKTSEAGTHCVGLRNEGLTRSYVSTYEVNQANTWEYKTITITHDDSGVWNYTSGVGVDINWNLGSGSDNETSTLDQWVNGNFFKATGAVDISNVNGATFKLHQVQLNEGAEALPFRRAGHNILDEYHMCTRYYWQGNLQVGGAADIGGNFRSNFQTWPSIMRAVPTTTLQDEALTFGSLTFRTPTAGAGAFPVASATSDLVGFYLFLGGIGAVPYSWSGVIYADAEL